MAQTKTIAQRIRNALKELPDVKEKKMFGRLAFMVNEKLCLTAGPEKMMCRIDPSLHKQEVEKPGCSTVEMGGRKYNGYIYIQEEYIIEEDEFDYWINLALDYNKLLTSNK